MKLDTIDHGVLGLGFVVEIGDGKDVDGDESGDNDGGAVVDEDEDEDEACCSMTNPNWFKASSKLWTVVRGRKLNWLAQRSLRCCGWEAVDDGGVGANNDSDEEVIVLLVGWLLLVVGWLLVVWLLELD